MPQDEVFKCPLCHGRGEVHRKEMLALLTDRSLPEQAERYLAELLNGAEETPAQVGVSRDFQRDVHSWNPQLAIWRRSPKE